MDRNVVVLGGGTGRAVAASRLAREPSSLGWGGRLAKVALERRWMLEWFRR